MSQLYSPLKQSKPQSTYDFIILGGEQKRQLHFLPSVFDNSARQSRAMSKQQSLVFEPIQEHLI